MGEHQEFEQRRKLGRLWYWTLRQLIHGAPFTFLAAVALGVWKVFLAGAAQADVQGVITVLSTMAATGIIGGLLVGHLREDRLLRRELTSKFEQLTRAPGDRPLRLLKSDPLSPGAHVAPSPRHNPR